ncbi:unnamed protein product [Albugo candida]|uniref:Tyrosine--tRNA ligase n=1 Tax=Albugo candida TaxID=65357 RepID=A0A024GFI3_9STRA|nr:unnamed protein product [Albugo candida]|eukprot:CCI45102.1 unnamed protein product [Albugo candida]
MTHKNMGQQMDHMLNRSLPSSLLNPPSIYCGFDPTASSLHIGNLLQAIALRHFQMSGYRPILLIGGATGMIGDPSGRAQERSLLSDTMVRSNAESLLNGLSTVLDLSDSVTGAIVVNNADWHGKMTVMEWMRHAGRHFRINKMLARENVKRRLESENGLSFLEFSYQLFQAYDFLHLFNQYGCNVQLGGSDQWGNIVGGCDLIKKTTGEEAFGLTLPLLTTVSGEKYGKSAGNALWLDSKKTSFFAFYQYFLRVQDCDVENHLKCFTFMELDEIQRICLEHLKAPEKRLAQKVLADNVMRMIHGKDGLEKAKRATNALFSENISHLQSSELHQLVQDAPVHIKRYEEIVKQQLVDLMAATGICRSKAEARRLILGGGVYINNIRVKAVDYVIESDAEYDYIIIGGGSAGCVLANRLTEDGQNEVLLVEAGLSDMHQWDSWKIHMPAALTYNLANDKYNWCYNTQAQRHLNNRRLSWPRGRVLGGSSSINAMVYIRGHANDYNDWEKSGATGWSYADCLPYFRKSQSHSLGANAYRGGSGPLHVTRGNQKNQILFQKFIDAAMQAGYPFTDDMNGYQQEGFGWMDMTIRKGRRWSASQAYLWPAIKRPNLKVITNTMTTKIEFQSRRAIGINVECNRTRRQTKIRANKEIILSGGAINSPQLLLLSGVGDADHLKQVDVPVVHHVPAVGKNLEDHLDLYVQYECTQPITLHHATWKYPRNMFQIALEWLLFQTGWGASAHLESGGFIRSAPGKCQPDLQYHFLPGALTGQLIPGNVHAMQAHCSPMRATSRGSIKLQSADPRAHPIIDPNYLDTLQDRIDIRAAVRLTREIFEQEGFDAYRGNPISPGVNVRSDEEIDAWVRQHAESAYHPSCTNRMGSECDSVVNPQLQVHGLECLRVVDASVMPNIVSGNLNAPTIMLAEKAADVILGNEPLAKEIVPVYEPPSWKDLQR